MLALGRSMLIGVIIIVGNVFVFASKGMGSPPTSGTISLRFEDEPIPSSPWSLSITARTGVSFTNGQLLLLVRQTDSSAKAAENILLWEGHLEQLDSITREYLLPAPQPGEYELTAAMLPFPKGSSSGTHGFSSTHYVAVTPDTVLISGIGIFELRRRVIEYELRLRGLSGLPETEWKRLAPDLAERWERMHGSDSVAPTATPSQESPVR